MELFGASRCPPSGTFTPRSLQQNVTLRSSQSRPAWNLGSVRLKMPPSASFTSRKINPTTFVIREDDAFEEHPLIYVKLHPQAPIIIVSDTGCDESSEEHRNGACDTFEISSFSDITNASVFP